MSTEELLDFLREVILSQQALIEKQQKLIDEMAARPAPVPYTPLTETIPCYGPTWINTPALPGNGVICKGISGDVKFVNTTETIPC